MNPHDHLKYDPATGLFLWKRTGFPAGTISKDGYRIIMIQGVNYPASNLAWFMVKGVWPSLDIDHKDRVRDNDAWSNLREATRTQNNANGATRCDNKFKMRGVSLHRASGRYRADIRLNGKQKNLGYFPTPEAAFAAYKQAHVEAHGEFSPYAEDFA